MDLKGKAALVTGGAVRVGRAIAIALAGRGADVTLTYHSSDAEAVEVREEIERLGVRGLAVKCDQRDEEQVLEAIRRHMEAFGRLDVLVNSAAIFDRTPFDTLDCAAWDRLMDTNARGPFLFAIHSAAALRANGCGKVVNIADIAALRPWKAYLPYCISKAAVIGLTMALARELAPEVQVNAIAPGVAVWPAEYTEQQKAAVLARVPLRRAGTAGDVANTVLYLVEGSDYVTGAVIPVDGGRLLE